MSKAQGFSCPQLTNSSNFSVQNLTGLPRIRSAATQKHKIPGLKHAYDSRYAPANKLE
jgi:hypothetical protein